MNDREKIGSKITHRGREIGIEAKNRQLRIRLATGSESQNKLRERLSVILKKHHLSRWFFTYEVVIDESDFSHSHPVLTLATNSDGAKSEMGLLSAFLHEQCHWFLSAHRVRLEKAMCELRHAYPQVKVGRKEGGARDEESTYLHLLVCLLEFEALSEVVGRKRAIGFVLRKPYYTWIYQRVVSDYRTLKRVALKEDLIP
jgi:hypothetical protein